MFFNQIMYIKLCFVFFVENLKTVINIMNLQKKAEIKETKYFQRLGKNGKSFLKERQ